MVRYTVRMASKGAFPEPFALRQAVPVTVMFMGLSAKQCNRKCVPKPDYLHNHMFSQRKKQGLAHPRRAHCEPFLAPWYAYRPHRDPSGLPIGAQSAIPLADFRALRSNCASMVCHMASLPPRVTGRALKGGRRASCRPPYGGAPRLSRACMGSRNCEPKVIPLPECPARGLTAHPVMFGWLVPKHDHMALYGLLRAI